MTVQDVGGSTTYLLGYDQVGSLKAAAAMDGESEGGLRDEFTGLVRF